MVIWMISYHAKYTVVLKSLLENEEIKGKIDDALSEYPIYTPKSKGEYIPVITPSREELNRKILDYYKYREIGFETVGRFLDELRIAMNEIMPHYNQLMFSQDQDFNIIYNVDYVRKTDTKRDGEQLATLLGENTGIVATDGEGTAKTTAEDNTVGSSISTHYTKNVKSGTPQDSLSITAKDIDRVDYADEATWNEDDANDATTTKGTSEGVSETTTKQVVDSTSENRAETKGENKENELTEEIVKGNYGQVSAQRLIMTYRQTILNIEQMIINDRRIQELFMLVY